MRRMLPPLTALICFEAVSRSLNITRAAEDLNLTQSAVSRQIKSLEEFLQRDLFRRVKKKLILTDQGKRYAEDVCEILEQLETATLKISRSASGRGVLNIGTPPTFGARWLIPRLPRFIEDNSHLQVNIVSLVRNQDFAAENIDIAVWFGREFWPGVVSEKLFDEGMIAVCTPGLIAGNPPKQPLDILKFPLLVPTTRPTAWRKWFANHDCANPDYKVGSKVERFHVGIQLAVLGTGVAIVPEFLVRQELDSGALVAPFGPAMPTDETYNLISTKNKMELPKVIAFRDWLRRMADEND